MIFHRNKYRICAEAAPSDQKLEKVFPRHPLHFPRLPDIISGYPEIICQDDNAYARREFKLYAKLTENPKIFFLWIFFPDFKKGLPKKKFKFSNDFEFFSMENPHFSRIVALLSPYKFFSDPNCKQNQLRNQKYFFVEFFSRLQEGTSQEEVQVFKTF